MNDEVTIGVDHRAAISDHSDRKMPIARSSFIDCEMTSPASSQASGRAA